MCRRGTYEVSPVIIRSVFPTNKFQVRISPTLNLQQSNGIGFHICTLLALSNVRQVREQKLRRSELVSTYGDKLIDSGRLGAEERE